MQFAFSGARARGRRSGVWGPAAAALGVGAILWAQMAPATALPAEGFADLAERVTPAVVNISSTHLAAGGYSQFDMPPGSSLEDLMRRFEEQMRPQGSRPTTALGSGFIISPDGYVVTNNHVIDEADSVTVNLPDGESFEAKIVGVDPQTDLALLKIDAGKPLPHVGWGDSDKLRVGDYVMAVGNPFGLGGSVTAGIVSARGRDIHAGPYDDFIQTDAAINRGNSGGPMFNLTGQVVGVNSAIVSPNGGSVGIGFAIPSNLAKKVVTDLMEKGTVERGWLGVKIQPVTEDIQEALSLPAAQGALVAEVIKGSPAEAAKLRQGDVILGFDGQPVKGLRDLTRAVANTKVGSKASLTLWRGGQEQTLSVTIARQDPVQMGMAPAPAQEEPKAEPSAQLGVLLAPLDEALREKLQLPEDAQGVAVIGVEPGGRAASRGIAVGDVIKQIGDEPVSTPDEVNRALEDAGRNSVLVLVNRGGEEQFLAFKMNDA